MAFDLHYPDIVMYEIFVGKPYRGGGIGRILSSKLQIWAANLAAHVFWFDLDNFRPIIRSTSLPSGIRKGASPKFGVIRGFFSSHFLRGSSRADFALKCTFRRDRRIGGLQDWMHKPTWLLQFQTRTLDALRKRCARWRRAKFADKLNIMSKLLEMALEKVDALPQDEQDAIASQILASLADEDAWRTRFVEKRDVIHRMAREGLEDDARGETLPLDDLL